MFFQVLTNFLWASLLACLLIGELVNGDDKAEVKLEVLLSKVSNRSTLRECCDKNGGSSCTNICDIYFVVCIPKPALCQNSSVFLRTSSKFSSPLKNSTSSNKNSSGNFLSMLFNVNVKDLTSFTITIYPRDGSIIDSSTPVGVASHTETFLRPRPTSPIQRTYSKNNITFVFIYRLNVTCAKHYYGENCVYCLGRNDRFGHSRCLQNGTKVCIYGWKGRSCTEPYCPDGCVNGNCKQPFECSCKSGWRGPKCTECIPNTKCRHGYCDRPFDCLCKASWTGQYCDVVMNYCIRFNPCRNGRCHNSYRTNYTCSCFNGWKGQLCDEPACSSSCNLSNADCTNDRCSCRQGWTGPDCNKCLPSPGCKHGVCLTPFQCLCNHGWQGENCSQPVSYCKQQSQNPCQNNGTCVDISSNEHRCDCKEGFSGFHCDIVECSSSCRGKCEGNVCRCRSGWKGKNCSECVKRSSCIHGYCKQPDECICHKNWTGLFCNVSNVEHGSSHIIMTTSTLQDRPDMTWLICVLSILSSLIIFTTLAFLVRKQCRKRARFDVPSSSSHVVVNRHTRYAYYTTGTNHRIENLGLNNNNPVDLDFKSYSEIILNPMSLKHSQNSKSMLISDSGIEYDINEETTVDKESPDKKKYTAI